MIRTTILALAPLAAHAAEPPKPLMGTWGTPAQCAGTLLKDGGTVRASPFRIDGPWLSHGSLWCRLTWFPSQPRAGGHYATARAQCGEDSVQGYWLAFDLTGETLTLIWNETLMNDGLRRCP